MKDRAKRKKRGYWTIGTCLFLLLGWILSPVIFSTGLLKSRLSNYVDEVTNHEYRLSVADLSFNPLTGKLSLDSVSLINRKKTRNYIAIEAVNVTVKGAATNILFFKGDLKIRKLQVTEPLIRVYHEKGNRKAQITKEELFNQLQKFSGKKIKTIKVGTIKIKDAGIEHYQLSTNALPTRSFRNFDMLVTDFEVNPQISDRQKEFFRADKIDIRLRDFNRVLGDNRHQLHLDELTYSLQDKKIRGKNIRLSPIDTTAGSGTLYWVKIPLVEMKPAEPYRFTDDDTINIESLYLQQSKIRIRPSEPAIGINLQKLREFDLYQLFRNDFHALTIKHLFMEGTSMRIDSRTGNDKIFQEFHAIKISLNGFDLDSTAWMDRSKILYSDDFQLAIGGYLLKFNDQVHQFSAANILASSRDSLIQASRIQLIPVNAGIRLPTTVNMTCDSIRLRSVDFARLFHQRELPLQKITAFNPTVHIDQFEKPTVKNTDHQSLLYHFIGNYIKRIYAREVAIENGHLAINNLQNLADPGIIEADFDFRLTDFSIDSVTAQQTEKLFYATNIDLSFRDYNMKLADEIHRLKIAQIDVSSRQKLVNLKNLNLFPDNRINIQEAMSRLKKTELYHLKVPSLVLLHIDINQAFFRKNLIISHFSIIKPDIYLELFGNMKNTIKREQSQACLGLSGVSKSGGQVRVEDKLAWTMPNGSHLHEVNSREAKKQEKEFNLAEFYDLLSNYLVHIEVGKIEAPDGQLRLVNHSRKGKTIDLTNRFSLNLEHFVLNDDELDKDRLLFSDHFDLKLKDHLFKLSDHVHLLKAKEVDLSSKNASVSVSDALLYPLISSPAYQSLPWHLQIKIPQITLKQVDMKQIYFDQILRVGRLSIDSPVIEIYRNSQKTKKFNFRDLTIPLPEEMKELTVAKASLNHGKLKIYQNTPVQFKLIAGSGIDFLIEQGTLKRTANTSTAKFSSETIETKLTGLHLSPDHIPYTVDVKQINFSSNKGLLSFSGLDIHTAKTNEKRMVAGIRIPVLRFEQLDPVDAFQNNRFHAGLIYSEKPVFILNLTGQKVTKNPLFVKLPDDIQPLMDELSAEKVTVKDASFIFQQSDHEKKEYPHIDITLNRFRLDSVQSEKPFGTDNLFISKDNNQFSGKNNHYDFWVDRISFSGHKNTLSFSEIKILPRYTREAYQKIIPWQTDHYSGSIEKIDLSGIDLDRWFENRELKGTNILISHPQIEIYRDKRTPFNKKQKKAMPQDLIKSIRIPFYFDSVTVSDAAISYAEQSEHPTGPGIVRFSKLNGHLWPFSNQDQVWKSHSGMTLTARGLLMNSSTLNVRMDFNMNTPSSGFHVTGSLSPFQLAALNPVTEFNAHIMIRSGELNRFDFNFQGDSVRTSGKLWFAYDDLKISVLEQKNGDTREAKWLSFLANNLMLKSKNPRTKTLVPDDIYFERDPSRSVFNYWWKSIFSGAKNTFGINEE